MSDPSSATHPSTADLLLIAAGEHESLDRAADKRAHVAECAQCRRRLAELEHGDAQLEQYWRTRLSDAPPPPPLSSLKDRLQLIREPSLRQRLGWRRPLAAAAAVACLLIVSRQMGFWSPQSVEAAELLRNATEQRSRATGGTALVKAVEIRAGNRVFRNRGQAAADAQLLQALELARVNWQDPLNPEDFARWREEQPRKQDQVTRDAGWVRLTTTVLGDGPVRSASITVSQPGWRPLARTVQYKDLEALDIQEVAEEPARDAAADSIARIPAAGAAPELSATPGPVSTNESDALEVRLWEAMRGLNADVLDAGQLRRQSGTVCYEVWPDEQRSAAVHSTLSAITKPCAMHVQFPGPARVMRPLAGAGASKAPFADALAARFGSQESADRHVDRVLREYVVVLARVSTLERYLRWFSPDRFDRLAPALQERVRAIAADHVAAIQRDGGLYLKSVSQALEAALPQGDRITLQPPSAPPQRCGTLSAASSLASDLKELQQGFSRLFEVGEESTSDVALMRRTAGLQSALGTRIAGLCVAPQR